MEIWQENALRNISALLEGLNLSQLAFAKNAKISPTHLNMVMKGHRPITRQLVAAIAAHVGKDTDWFYIDHSASKQTSPTPTIQELAKLITDQEAEIQSLRAELDRLKSSQPKPDISPAQSELLAEIGRRPNPDAVARGALRALRRQLANNPKADKRRS